MINPDRVAFTIAGLQIYWYGILLAVGIICAVTLAFAEARRQKMHKDTVLDLCLVLIPCGVVGARLYYVLFNLDTYLKSPLNIFNLREGGLAIYGAVIGGLLGLFIYARIKKIRFLKLTDLIIPGLALAQSIGRWGNFFNQEAYGLPVTNPDLLFFPLCVKIDGVHWFDYGDGNGLVLCQHPYHLATFFYESIWCLLLFAFLWFFLRKRKKHDGDLLIWYLMLYGLERMFVEGLRGDSLWLIHDVVRVSQALSFLLFAAALLFLLIRHFREKKQGRLMWPAPEAVIVADEAATDELKDEEAGADAVEDGEDTKDAGMDAEEPGQEQAEENAIEENEEDSDREANAPKEAAQETPDENSKEQ